MEKERKGGRQEDGNERNRTDSSRIGKEEVPNCCVGVGWICGREEEEESTELFSAFLNLKTYIESQPRISSPSLLMRTACQTTIVGGVKVQKSVRALIMFAAVRSSVRITHVVWVKIVGKV